MLMQRTPQQIAEEDAILDQAKSIDAARRAEEAAARGPSIPGETPPPTGRLANLHPMKLQLALPFLSVMGGLSGAKISPIGLYTLLMLLSWNRISQCRFLRESCSRVLWNRHGALRCNAHHSADK